ncbi:MAG: hypothetical protein R3F30_01555 [Planctomycetota bacterium]
MKDALHLALRYLAHYRGRSLVLVLSLALLLFVPIGLRLLISRSAEALSARAAASPLLVGAKGSSVDLVLRALYFEGRAPEPIPWSEVERVQDSGHALAIPLHVRFRAGRLPLVGTTLDYFGFRGLEVARGGQLIRLGDCVLGARAADRLGLGPGDAVVTSPETVFDVAGVYPLELRVRGVLAPSGGPDDEAVFCAIETAWVVEGIGHGHEDLATSPTGVLKREGDTITGNASVQEFRRITPDNIDSFHFHGDRAGFPVTAVLAVPPDARASALLQGRYQGPDEARQIVVPAKVLDELLSTVFTVEGFVTLALGLVGLATLLTAALVFVLSLRLRARELATMRDIGASPARIRMLLLCEVGYLVLGAATIAALLLALTGGLLDGLLRRTLFG